MNQKSLSETRGGSLSAKTLLDKGEAGVRGLEHTLRAVAVLHVAGMSLDLEQAPVGVGQDVALAPMGLLGPVEALESPF